MKPIGIVKKSVGIVTAAVFAIILTSISFAQQAAPQAQGEKKDLQGQKVDEEVTGWRVRDFRPYIKAIEELEKLNKDYSDNLLKLAVDEYSTGLDILEDMENEIGKLKTQFKNDKNLNERFYWQEIDRRNAQQSKVGYKKAEAKMKAVTYFTKAIKYVDEIQSVELQEDPKMIAFKTRLYQVYVSTQYDLNNFKPCIGLLERYITLSDACKKDVWAYKYLASCYGYIEKTLTKYRHAAEDEIMIYRNKKNRSMLQAVELKYGIDSPHYKLLQEIVEIDEKKTENINDFK